MNRRRVRDSIADANDPTNFPIVRRQSVKLARVINEPDCDGLRSSAKKSIGTSGIRSWRRSKE